MHRRLALTMVAALVFAGSTIAQNKLPPLRTGVDGTFAPHAMPKLGGGMPFHPLSLGYASRTDPARNCFLTVEMLREAHAMAEKIGKALPPDYPIEMKTAVLRELEKITRSSPRHVEARRMSAT